MDTATSKTTVNLVIIFLGVFALAALAAVTFLIDGGQAADKVAIIVGPMGVALGAVAGVLASTRSPIAAQIPQPAAILADAGLVAVPAAPATPAPAPQYQPTLDAPLPIEDHAQV